MHPTKIEWADYASNPIRCHDLAKDRRGWHCEKVAVGCAHCYSEALNKRFGTGRPFSRAEYSCVEHFLDTGELGKLCRSKAIKGKVVFLCDMTDIFGTWVQENWRHAIFDVIRERSDVSWVILTKRPVNAYDYLCNRLPIANLLVGASISDSGTIVDAEPYLWRLHQARWRILVSAEPLLGAVPLPQRWFDWLIIGCESGAARRPCELQWVRDAVATARQCKVPVFVKQLSINGKVSRDPAEWPEDLRVREYPTKGVGTC